MNERSPAERWTAALRERLEQDLHEQLDRSISIFLDSYDTGATDVVLRKASCSAVLLFVSSADSWRPTSFCRRELTAFRSGAHPNDKTRLSQYVTIVRGDPAPHERPEDLPDVYPLDFSFDSADAYTVLLRKLKDRLLGLSRAIETTVFVAPTSSNLNDSAVHLAEEFRLGKPPLHPLRSPFMSSEPTFQSECARLLRWSGCSVHLIDDEFNSTQPDWARSSQLLGLQLACERFGDARNRVCVYVKPESKPRLTRSALAGTASLDDLSGSPLQGVAEHMREVVNYRRFRSPSLAGPTEERFIYFQCSPADEHVYRALNEKLKSKNIKLLLGSADAGNLQRNWLADRTFLARWDKAVVYWGQHKQSDVLRYGGKLAEFEGPKILAIHPATRSLNLPDFRTVSIEDLESEL